MELGMIAPKCSCVQVCEKGVEPMMDCICKLPGETITAHCEICDPTKQKFTWHNNGACISCVRKAREEKKAMKLARFHKEPTAELEDAIVLNNEEVPTNKVVLSQREMWKMHEATRDRFDEKDAKRILRDSSAAEQAPVKRQVVGSIPTPAANPDEIALVLRVGKSEIVLTTSMARIEMFIHSLQR